MTLNRGAAWPIHAATDGAAGVDLTSDFALRLTTPVNSLLSSLIETTKGVDVSRFRRNLATILLLSAVLISAHPFVVIAQVDPAIRDRILPAAVQIAIVVTFTENGVNDSAYVPVGSGTIVAPIGLILTNHHVVDMLAHRDELERWEVEARSMGDDLRIELVEGELLILGSEDTRPPMPLYVARMVEHDANLDLAVLQVTGDALGNPLDVENMSLPYVPLGDSDLVALGEPIDIYSYPLAGGDSLTYTTGVVSGFNFEDGQGGPVWITTDATISGGSSGGSAVNRRGELIGVPTQGSSLDCRPGDTNLDGTVDAEDVGCIPVGGSIGQLRPINLATSLLERSGAQLLESDAGPPISSPDIVQSASAAYPTLRWSIDLGNLVGTPVVDSGVVFASSGQKQLEGGNAVLYAVDAQSGQLLWSLPFAESITDPVVGGGTVYVGGKEGNIYALDAATGQELWRFAGGYSALKPVISGGEVLALFSNETGGYLEYFWPSSVGEVLFSLDTETGQPLWQFEVEESIGEPVSTGDMVFFRTGSDPIPGIAKCTEIPAPTTVPSLSSGWNEVVGVDAKTGRTIWTCLTDMGALATLLTDGTTIFVKNSNGGSGAGGGSTTVLALNVSTGQERWQFVAPYWTDSLFFADGNVLFQGYVSEPDRTESLYVIDARSGLERWSLTLNGFFSDPAIAVGSVFFVGDGSLYVVDVATGQQRWTVPLQESWDSANLIADDSGLYVGSSNGNLYAFNVR